MKGYIFMKKNLLSLSVILSSLLLSSCGYQEITLEEVHKDIEVAKESFSFDNVKLMSYSVDNEMVKDEKKYVVSVKCEYEYFEDKVVFKNSVNKDNAKGKSTYSYQLEVGKNSYNINTVTDGEEVNVSFVANNALDQAQVDTYRKGIEASFYICPSSDYSLAPLFMLYGNEFKDLSNSSYFKDFSGKKNSSSYLISYGVEATYEGFDSVVSHSYELEYDSSFILKKGKRVGQLVSTSFGLAGEEGIFEATFNYKCDYKLK